MSSGKKFEELAEMISRFRGPNGCAWKKQLNLHNLPPFSKAEFQELMQAVEKEDWENLREELGDVLFHILLYCEIAKEQKKFTIDDVLEEIVEKMKRRNPHVYGNVKCTDPKEIAEMWEEIKKQEKKERQEKKEKLEKINRKNKW